MNWQQWKTKYKRELQHIAGFEEKFVDLVLSQIPNLSPDDVIPQYHFIDSKGGNRYVDFMIINQSKNWLLPIELDGHTKLTEYGNVYEHFDDMLYRQNCIIQKFGTLLRYTNKRMFNHNIQIIQEITQTLHNQSQIKSTKDIQEANAQQLIRDYETKLSELQQKNVSSTQSQEMMILLAEMKNELKTLKEKSGIRETAHQHKRTKSVLVEETSYKAKQRTPILKFIIIFIILGIISFGLLVAYFYTHSDIEVGHMPKPDFPKVHYPSKTDTVYEEVTETRITPPYKPQSEINQEKPKLEPTTNQEHRPVPIEETKTEIQETPKQNYTVGEVANVCGKVSEVRYNQSNGNNYLNINGKYPNQEITFTVWIDEDLSYYLDKTVCTYGTVNEYKGRLSINVNSLKGLKEK